jgi:hypothetical protein
VSENRRGVANNPLTVGVGIGNVGPAGVVRFADQSSVSPPRVDGMNVVTFALDRTIQFGFDGEGSLCTCTLDGDIATKRVTQALSALRTLSTDQSL